MLKRLKYYIVILALFSNILGDAVFAADVNLSTFVTPIDATLFQSTPGYNPGAGECEITWTSSLTPNISNQIIYVDDGSTITSASYPFLGSSVPDSTILAGLIPGWTYTLQHVSEAGALASTGVWTVCIPAIVNPAPVLFAEPAVTQGTENTLYWTNGGLDDALLECRLTASFTYLNVDPNGTIEEDSGWIPCPTSTVTYDHTFTGLTINSTYFYHVQSRHPVDGLSPYSNVEFSTQNTTSGGGNPSTTVCGNGAIESGEQCDDGNRTPGDGCNAFCAIEPAICGNNLVEAPETCDDGNTTSGDGCSNVCVAEQPVVCGNAVLETNEECDDGNLLNNDGCSNICEFEIPEFCGDGLVQAPEQCDDGNNASGDGCSPICEVEHAAAPVCGDAFREDPEECDDGNLIDGDGCTATCTLEALPVCGNALVELPEECDDGNIVDGDGCDAVCALEPLPICGNAILEAPEECDDGNVLNFDGCDEFCIEEEIVEVFLHITGAPEHRKTNYYNLPEGERATSSADEEFSLTTALNFGSADLFRVNNTPNLGLNADLLLYKPSAGSLDTVGTALDNFGESFIAVEVITGSYDFALNGEAHNNRVLRNIVINAASEGTIIDLDFTNAETQKLVAGDTRDDNLVNALDIATMLGSYKVTGENKNDLNKDESPIVNAIDIAILIWNYKKTGEVL